MKKTLLTLIALFILMTVVLSGCGSAAVNGGETSGTANTASAAKSSGAAEKTDTQELFSSRDLSGEYDTEGAVNITLDGDSVSVSSDAVTVSGKAININKEGVYIFSGTLNDGYIVVNVSKEEKVQIVLNGVSITSETFAPIYVISCDKTFITLVSGTQNSLANRGVFEQIDENDVDAVIFSKDDITLNGTGTLTVKSPAGHGIVGKDEVTIASGTYNVTSSKTAIRANDSVAVADGTFTLTAGTDGIHAENNDDDTLGAVYIKGGAFKIKSGDDGIHATTTLQIDGGSFDITAAEGLEATYIKINDGTVSISASDDGINAAKKSTFRTPTVEINGGSITVVMGAGDTDGIDSNGNIEINGGTVNVTANSPFDYDGTGVINGGKVIVNGSEVTTLSNQMMGGGGRGGNFGGGFGGRGGKGGFGG